MQMDTLTKLREVMKVYAKHPHATRGQAVREKLQQLKQAEKPQTNRKQ